MAGDNMESLLLGDDDSSSGESDKEQAIAGSTNQPAAAPPHASAVAPSMSQYEMAKRLISNILYNTMTKVCEKWQLMFRLRLRTITARTGWIDTICLCKIKKYPKKILQKTVIKPCDIFVCAV